MCRNLSCLRMFHWLLTPLFVLLDASVKSMCFGKLSHPWVPSRQVKTVIFISKITITTISPILNFAPMGTHSTLHCPKKEQNYCHLAYVSQPLLSIPVAFINHKLLFGPTVHIILPQNLKQLYSFCVLVTLVLCQEIGSTSHKLSISHIRSTGNVHKLCIEIT